MMHRAKSCIKTWCDWGDVQRELDDKIGLKIVLLWRLMLHQSHWNFTSKFHTMYHYPCWNNYWEREREREITKTEKKMMQFKEDEQKEAINSTEQPEVGITKTSKKRVLMVIPLSWCHRALIKKRDRPSQCFKHWWVTLPNESSLLLSPCFVLMLFLFGMECENRKSSPPGFWISQLATPRSQEHNRVH